MSTLSMTPLAFVDKTVAEMVERIARETAAMSNRLGRKSWQKYRPPGRGQGVRVSYAR